MPKIFHGQPSIPELFLMCPENRERLTQKAASVELGSLPKNRLHFFFQDLDHAKSFGWANLASPRIDKVHQS
jgi:hypothetical protein